MRLAIEHQLSFTPPPGSGQLVMQLLLTPPSGPSQKVVRWSVDASGLGNASRFSDAFGNTAHLVNVSRPEGPVTLVARGVVDTTDTNGVLGRLSGEPVPALFRRLLPPAVLPPGLLDGLDPAGNRLELLHTLLLRIREDFTAAAPRQMQADGAQEQDLGGGPSSAASQAELFIAAARSLGVPARHVSGYLLGEEDGTLHAWAEAWDDRLGWVGFDPKLQLCSTDAHVRLAVGLDALGAHPLRSVPAAELTQSVSVTAE